jgi:hypothetical protein
MTAEYTAQLARRDLVEALLVVGIVTQILVAVFQRLSRHDERHKRSAGNSAAY